MARKRAHTTAKAASQAPSAQTASLLRRGSRSTRASHPVYDDASDAEDESKMAPNKSAKRARTQPKPHEAERETGQSPPTPRYNTRSKNVQLSKPSEDALTTVEEGIEELPVWPRYKDDLLNAFNGAVDPSLDFISKAPVEIIDMIISLLILDHDPDRGVKEKAGNYKRNPHVLISMSAMSRLFYHTSEGFAFRFLTKNKIVIPPFPWWLFCDRSTSDAYKGYVRKMERQSELRRSSRLASKPEPAKHEIYRMELIRALQSRCAICLVRTYGRPGQFANRVTVCGTCDESMNGSCMTLTDALKNFDLRDYMLLKSRKPGPRAKFLDLPPIIYNTTVKAVGYPMFISVTSFTFRRKDVEMIARHVHGDMEGHMQQKRRERYLRGCKARGRRIRDFKVAYHESELKVATGKSARRHEKAIDTLLELDSDDEEFFRHPCTAGFCYHGIGLCLRCGDVQNRNVDLDDCDFCWERWADRKHKEYDEYLEVQIAKGR